MGYRNHIALLVPAACVAALDQTTKYLVQKHIDLHTVIPIIQGFLNLVHVRNKGAAFGMFHSFSSGTITFLLTVISISVVIFVVLYAIKSTDRKTVLALSLIIGGAAGNLIDRLMLGEVVDFIDIYLGSYHWPAFNVADAAITVGTALFLLLHLHRGKRPEERS